MYIISYLFGSVINYNLLSTPNKSVFLQHLKILKTHSEMDLLKNILKVSLLAQIELFNKDTLIIVKQLKYQSKKYRSQDVIKFFHFHLCRNISLFTKKK